MSSNSFLWEVIHLLFFSYALCSCQSLEDGANSCQASQEATNSLDEQVSGAQPVNDLALKVERQVIFCTLPNTLYLFLGKQFCVIGVFLLLFFLTNGFNYRILVLIQLLWQTFMWSYFHLPVCDNTSVDRKTTSKLISFFTYSERKGQSGKL